MSKTTLVDESNESGIGLPHSKTLSRQMARPSLREILECGNPMPLYLPFAGKLEFIE
jgi:hypothetical protein